jgi:hypothetical protein
LKRDTGHLLECGLAITGQLQRGIAQAERALPTCFSLDLGQWRALGYQGTQAVVECQDLGNRPTSPIAGAATSATTSATPEAAAGGFRCQVEGSDIA